MYIVFSPYFYLLQSKLDLWQNLLLTINMNKNIWIEEVLRKLYIVIFLKEPFSSTSGSLQSYAMHYKSSLKKQKKSEIYLLNDQFCSLY